MMKSYPLLELSSSREAIDFARAACVVALNKIIRSRSAATRIHSPPSKILFSLIEKIFRWRVKEKIVKSILLGSASNESGGGTTVHRQKVSLSFKQTLFHFLPARRKVNKKGGLKKGPGQSP